jgi:hypothetical protein
MYARHVLLYKDRYRRPVLGNVARKKIVVLKYDYPNKQVDNIF